MISVDTNILVHLANPMSSQHEAARKCISSYQSKELVLCELILLELYLKLRNPKIFPKPYSAAEAVAFCDNLKSNPAWQVVDYAPEIAPILWGWARETKRGFRNVIDARIAFTLEYHGVKKFITANTKDFKEFHFDELINPLS